MIEMLVVVAILSAVAAMLLPALTRSKKAAHEAACISRLRQFHTAVLLYKNESEQRIPPWLSNLYPSYLTNEEIYICLSDSSEGTQGCRPDFLHQGAADYQLYQVAELDDTARNDDPLRNRRIEACSYLYEFADTPVRYDWWKTQLGVDVAQVDRDGDGEATWYEVKKYQLVYGDLYSDAPYAETVLPLIRCFWHVKGREAQVGEETYVDLDDYNDVVLSLAYAGNVYKSGPLWEKTHR